ncbi:hypothetical protein FPV67DRAFT_1668686 [Lyophyllum atratum]|nr:hypothetical protein FPV67DRAFT_1668686 [Lyophyllum atratum]
MNKSKERLNRKYVQGKVSLTCNAWQASNTNGYFAVMGHWIEELPSTYNGESLGQALYKICLRLRIVYKIGHITCDNALNNGTMIDEFTRLYELSTGKTLMSRNVTYGMAYACLEILLLNLCLPRRCLAHIINLATQALISAQSKSKYYNPHSEDKDEHIPDLDVFDCDELGLECSFAQRKEPFKVVQLRSGVAQPIQLLLDISRAKLGAKLGSKLDANHAPEHNLQSNFANQSNFAFPTSSKLKKKLGLKFGTKLATVKHPNDLIFQEVPTTSDVEKDLEDMDIDQEVVQDSENFSWDMLLQDNIDE